MRVGIREGEAASLKQAHTFLRQKLTEQRPKDRQKRPKLQYNSELRNPCKSSST